jgi:hypothetical protein
MGVKGSWQRPGEGYADGWDAIFGKKPKEQPVPKEQEPQNDEKDKEE